MAVKGDHLMKLNAFCGTKLLYAGMISLVAVLSFIRPYHNGDVVAYVATAIIFRSNSNPDFVEIHRKAWATVKSSIPASHFQMLSNSPWTPKNSAIFGEFLPYYAMKPLYVIAMEGLNVLGVPLVRAAVIISILSYVGIASLLWKWIGWPAFVVMIAPPAIAMARVEQPDALNLLLAMTGFYLICERRRYGFGSLMLLMCIWCRPNMVILSGITFFALWLAKKVDLNGFVLISVLALGSYWSIMHFSGDYGWSVFFERYFDNLATPGEAVVHITPGIYIKNALESLHSLEFQNVYPPTEAVQSSLLLFVLFGVLAIRFHTDQVYRVLTLATLSAIAVSFLCLPTLYFRFYAPMYLFLTVSFISSLKPLAEKTGWRRYA
jgi:hypothetical protein